MSTFRLSASPAFRLSLLIITGILLCHWFDLPGDVLVPAFFAAILMACIVFFLSRQRPGLMATVTQAIMLVCILGGASKLAMDRDRSSYVPDSLLSGDVITLGRIVEPPHVAEKTIRFVMELREIRTDVGALKTKENIRVTLTRPRNESPLQLRYGMALALRGRLSRPSEARNPGEFSEKQYYEANGITLFMFVRGGSNGVMLDSTGGSWLMSRVIVPAREYILNTLDATTDGESAEFLKGLLIGERGGISAPTRQAFTNSGVAHVLAVSGSNVVVVAGIFFFVFGLLRLPKVAVVLLTLAALGFYMLVTGSQPPVVRATITASIFLIGSVLQVRANSFNSLGVAALIILAIDSRQLFDVGFQLSFMAVLSIVYLYPKMNAWISSLGSDTMIWSATLFLLRVCAVSVAASLGTLPLTAVYFGKVSIIGLLANIVVIPAVGASVVLGFVTIMASLFSNWIAEAYGAVNQLLLDWTLWIIRVSGATSFAYVDTSRFQSLYALPFYVLLLLLSNLSVPRVAKRLVFVLLISLNIVVFVPPSAAVATTGNLRVSFLDVGQGDASVIETPEGRVIVIDAGPKANEYDAGERTVAPFLRRRGISRVDLLVISHPHDDHIGGAPHILEQFDVAEVMESGQPVKSSTYRQYLSDIREEHCGVDTARSGMLVANFGDLRIHLLCPTPSFIDADTTHRHPNLNNTSVVMRMQYGNISMLFTGDAEEEEEQEMVDRYGDFLQSTLLKTGHHGSKTSSTQEFLDRVQPKYAIISAGRYNKFGHPSPEVVSRLRAMQTEVYRTDEVGAIILETDGTTLSLVDWR